MIDNLEKIKNYNSFLLKDVIKILNKYKLQSNSKNNKIVKLRKIKRKKY